MLGTYRLFLALLVALSHISIYIKGLNPGVIAVVGFYLVSGYVMTGLIRTHYATINKARNFYFDRALRLFPHYLAIACITFAWFIFTGTHTDHLKIQPSSFNIISNLLVVPQNYYMFNNASDFNLVPTSWSLGAEIQFYLVLPFVLLFNLRKTVIIFSLLVYLCAAFGLINSDWFGYRLLPGVLFMFFLGSLLFDLHQQNQSAAHRDHGKHLVYVAIATIAVLAVVLVYGHKINLPYNRETLLGLIIGLFVLHTFARRARHSLDEAIGNLSYGVFLNQYLVKWAFFGGQVSGLRNVVAYLATLLFIAVVMYFVVEKPILGFRRKLRTRTSNSALQRALRDKTAQLP